MLSFYMQKLNIFAYICSKNYMASTRALLGAMLELSGIYYEAT